MCREEALRELGRGERWDVLVIGGGATGLGAAVDAAARGFRTLLIEAHDFAKGTSSRSTKLVHGGVRYLRQGNIKLVREALAERARLLRNAPHLAHRMEFVIPAQSWWEIPFYGAGLTAYDLLAGSHGIGRSRILSAAETGHALPSLRGRVKGGIAYFDGQFDDARLAIALLRTLLDRGGAALNYAGVTGLLKQDGRIAGAVVKDHESGQTFDMHARVAINATGVFADRVRRMDEPEADGVITVSQGSHLVLDRRFLPGDSAMMIPRTADGRVLFAIPWHSAVVVGTTDESVPRPDEEPRTLETEREFLLSHTERFLGRRPQPDEVRSVWTGQRPLVRQQGASSTAAISRDHTVLVSRSGLISVIGGKWTTYRRMGEDAIDQAIRTGALIESPSRTAEMALHGAAEGPWPTEWARVYGDDWARIESLAESRGLNDLLHPALPFRAAEVIWAAQFEMARTVEDVLARRTRALFLNAEAAIEAAPVTARLLAQELNRSEEWEREQVATFTNLARGYQAKQ